MHPEYSQVSVTANIIQAVVDVLVKLNKENIEVPTDTQEMTNNVQATIARLVGGTGV